MEIPALLQTPSTTLIYIDNRVKSFLMLIIVSKCISVFSSQVILSDVHYHKYHHRHHQKISCTSVTVATSQHDLSFACLKSEWRSIFRYARSFSTLRVQVVLRRSFGHFYPAAVVLFPPAKLSDNPPLRKFWQRDRIK